MTRHSNRKPMSVATFKAAVSAGAYRQIAAALGPAKGFAPAPKKSKPKATTISAEQARADRRRLAKLLRDADERATHTNPEAAVNFWRKAMGKNVVPESNTGGTDRSADVNVRRSAKVDLWKAALRRDDNPGVCKRAGGATKRMAVASAWKKALKD